MIISIGGGAGAALDGNSPPAFSTRLASEIAALIQEYGFDGLDWDIEHFIGLVFLVI